MQGGLNDCGAKEGGGAGQEPGSTGCAEGLAARGRVGRVDSPHLEQPPSRAACPEVEPTGGTGSWPGGRKQETEKL